MIEHNEDDYDDSCDFYVPTAAELAWFWFAVATLTAAWSYCIIVIFSWLWSFFK